MRGPLRPARLLFALFAAGVCGAAATGCAVRPGYVDAATGRAYAGYAKPAFYCSDLCGLKECDCGRHPYVPPVAAFTSFPGLSAGFHNGVPPANTTAVFAPPPARYEDYQNNPALAPRRRPPAPRGGAADAVPPAPAPMPVPLGDALDGTLDDPRLPNPGLPDADLDAPFAPNETSPEGIGQ